MNKGPEFFGRWGACRVASIEIVPVTSSRNLQQFIDLPWKIYAGIPQWVPPLKADVRHLLDTAKHPFWQFSERQLFLARRGEETVGRIAAIIDHNYNRYHEERMGIWGFYECQARPRGFGRAVRRPERWVRGKNMAFIRGPLNPSTNYEIGTLIEGFEHSPTVMMTYNPQYYLDLIEASGYGKEKDLLAMLIDAEGNTSKRVTKLAERITPQPSHHGPQRRTQALRPRVGPDQEDLQRIVVEKLGLRAADRRRDRRDGQDPGQILDPQLVLFFFYEEDLAGLCIIVPDINPLLKRLNGKVGLTGIVKYLLYRKEVVGLRGMVFGFKEKYRKLGLPLVAFARLSKVITARKYKYFELGWNLEDNQDINNFDKELGGRVWKRYRIYRKEL